MSFNKKKAFDIAYIIGMLAFAVCILFAPKAGKLAMVGMAIRVILVWGVFIYLILKTKKIKGGLKENIVIYIACLGIALFALWNTKNFALDLISGPQQMKLYNIEIEKRQNAKGLIGLHYYLRGTDEEGERHIIEITGRDYDYMRKNSRDSIEFTCYINTKKLYKLGG
ncbi:MAG: hypothetical protein GX347_08625 [Epulopiscium sp.]|nr:hypothetical protein [Candidatus Epulonipiscium sp.]